MSITMPPAVTLAVTLEEARLSRRKGRLDNGCTYWRSDYFGGSQFTDREQPQGFLVEQDPATTVLAHFHEVDQFQVVVGGAGMLGRHKLPVPSVHYVHAYTGYGPLHADAEGLVYFTLRARHDSGARFFPEARPGQKRGPRRNLTGAGLPLLDDAARRALAAPTLHPVLEAHGDGLAAWQVRLGAEGVLPADAFGEASSLEHGGGRYWVVLGGSLVHEHRQWPPWACLFLPGTGVQPGFRAGPAGLEALVLQLPRPR